MKKIIAVLIALSFMTGTAQFPVLAETDTVEQISAYAQTQDNILPIQDSYESMNLYKDFNYYDCQWVPDEALFGVWDGVKWVPQQIPNGLNTNMYTVDKPLIKYDLEKYSQYFVPMEEAAKQGDYEECKRLLLEHFRKKFDEMPGNPGSTNSRAAVLEARMLSYNLFTNGNPKAADIVEVKSTDAWYTIDYTSQMSDIAKTDANLKGLNVELVAMEKDGYSIELDSSEGANSPRLEVELDDGTKKIYEPEADVTIRAGSNKNQKFGTLPTLTIEESESSIGTEGHADKNTARALIQFRTSDISPADVVKKAVLHVYGKSTKPESEQKKLLAAFGINYDSTMNNNNYTWMSMANHEIISAYGEDNPNCTFPRNHKEKLNFADNIFNVSARFNFSSLSRLFVATGNEEYAYHAIRILLGTYMKAGQLGGPENTSIFWPFNSKLSLGNRGQTIQSRYRELIHSKYMTPEVFAVLFKLAWTTGEQLEYCWQTQELTTNWGNTQATALFSMAMNFDEFEDAHKPIEDKELQTSKPGNGKTGGWRDLATYRLELKAGEVLFEDDSCSEIPMGYTDYAISGLRSAYNIAENANNVDSFPQSIIDTIERGTKYMIFSSAPNWSGWQQGNGHEHTMNIPVTAAQWLYNRGLTDDPTILWVATNGRLGKCPKETTKLYPVGKKFITRSGWDSDAIGSHFNADGGHNVHGHADDLSFDLFGYGEHLLIDNAVVDYTDNDIRAWQITSRGHNTVEINGISQVTPNWTMSTIKNDPFTGEKIYITENNPSGKFPDGRTSSGEITLRGELNDVEINNGYDYTRGVTYGNQNRIAGSTKFDDFRHERSMFFARPEYYIISDYMEPITKPNSENTYAQRWHFMPGVTADIDAETGVAKSKGGNASVIIAPIVTENKAEVSLNPGYYDTRKDNEHIKYEKTASGPTVMDTVIYPVAPGRDMDITTAPLSVKAEEKEATAFEATIKDNKLGNTINLYKMEKHNNRRDLKALNFGGYTSDGYLAFAEIRNGKLSAAAIQGGTQLKDAGNNYIVKSNNVVEGLSVAWNGKTLEINTDKAIVRDKTDIDIKTEIDLNALTVFCENVVSAVSINGENVPFNRSGRYIYFGSKPLIEDSVVPVETIKPSNNGTGGGGGTSHGSAPSNNKLKETSKPDNSTPSPEQTQSPVSTPEPDKASDDISDQFKAELQGHWANDEITELVKLGIVKGSDGTLNLNGNVTRAEFMVMLLQTLNIENVKYKGGIKDIDGNEWFADIMQTAADNDIMVGNDGYMRPNDFITREEMAKVLMKAAEIAQKLENINGAVVFNDSAQISDWAKPYVDAAVQAGFFVGSDDGMFNPKNNALRSEAMTVIYRFLKK